jgi:hypothetical protein
MDPLTQIVGIATSNGLLHKLHGRGSTLRSSLYVDDAAIFIVPIKEDIQNHSSIVEGFGSKLFQRHHG